MLGRITNDFFKVVDVVVVEFYATILFTSSKIYSAGVIDKNQMTKE